MHIVLIGCSSLESPLRNAGYAVTSIAPPTPIGEGAADLQCRIQFGEQTLSRIRDAKPTLLIDHDGAGLAFVRGPGGMAELKLLHETLGIPLMTLCRAPLPAVARGLPWQIIWQTMQSKTWVKVFRDRRQVDDLLAFGVPGVVYDRSTHMELDVARHLSVEAAPDGPGVQGHAVLCHAAAGLEEVCGIPAKNNREAWSGRVGSAVGGYPGSPPFFDIYHHVYDCGQPPAASDTSEQLAASFEDFMRCKQRFVGELSLRARDRFVLFLHAKLGKEFTLIGSGWQEHYGIPAATVTDDLAQLSQLYRQSAINLVLGDANGESMIGAEAMRIAAFGGFVLAYHTADIGDYLTPGKECDVFTDESDLLQKIARYLESPQERMRIAEAGKRRVLEDGLLDQRLDALIRQTMIQVASGERAAPHNGDAHAAYADVQSDISRALATISPSGRDESGRQGLASSRETSQHSRPTVTAGRGIEVGGTEEGGTEEGATATHAADRRACAGLNPRDQVIPVENRPQRVLVLQNPGKFTRHYLADIAEALNALGIEPVTMELSEVWEASNRGETIDASPLARRLAELNVRAVVGSGMNGVFEWPMVRESDGRPIPLFEQIGIPHLLWWTDHPQWACERQALRPELQAAFQSPNCHHFVKNDQAAEELRTVLHWPNCYGLPVAENACRLKPVENVEPEYDVVSIIGSPPVLDEKIEALLSDDDPSVTQIQSIIADSVEPELASVWEHHAPSNLRDDAVAFGKAWINARKQEANIGNLGIVNGLAESHPEVVDWLLSTHMAYFEALEKMWAFGSWQRIFYTRFAAKYFTVGVFGHEGWREAGIPGGGWVEHDDMPSVYAKGRLALNVTQRGDEEGVAHKPFQIAASGVPMLHNDVPGLADCFAPDFEVVRFDSPARLRESIQTLLDNDELRRSMGRAARERLKREHTWRHRLPQMFALAGIRLQGITASAPAGAVGACSGSMVEGRGSEDMKRAGRKTGLQSPHPGLPI